MITQNIDFDIPDDRLFIDKVGFQFPSQHLNGDVYRGFATGPITLLKWGNTARVLVHDELLQTEGRPAEAVMKALVWLSMAGVFDLFYAMRIQGAWMMFCQGLVTFEVALKWVLLAFELDELELTMDLNGIEYLAAFNPEVFRQVKKWTFYTKADFQRKRRGPDSKRAGESKGVQKSFLTAYRKDLQMGFEYPVYRLELRFSGQKYRRYIGPELLFLTPQDAYMSLLPSTREVLGKLKVKDSIEFNPVASLFPDSLLGQFLKDVNWFDQAEATLAGAEGGNINHYNFSGAGK